MADIIPTAPHKDFEQIKKVDENGNEYWEARELMPLLGYNKWENFLSVIQKAKEACFNSGQEVKNHFPDVRKMIRIATGTPQETYREVIEYRLSRYACYLIAQNGDSRKKEIAHAQTYFAIQTRRQEIFQQFGEEDKRLYVRQEVKEHNKKLFSTAKQAGVSDFGSFNNAGYLGLYGMHTDAIKNKKGIDDDNILDRAGTTELAANLFRITQTDEIIKKDKIDGQGKATYTHMRVGQRIRKTISDIGGVLPENLSPEKHIKEVEKQKKKLLKSSSTKILE